MIIAIHQPNYLPWLGYFSKIHLSDTFVFHDVVQFTDRGYTKRTQIRKAKDSQQKTWLTVPVKNHDTGTPIYDIEINHLEDWTQAHLRKIMNTYAGAEFFADIYPWIGKLLDGIQGYRRLGDMNITLIKEVCSLIGIHSEWHTSAQVGGKGSAEELNCNIVTKLGGSVYLSGTGASDYQEGKVFDDAGVLLRYHDVKGWLQKHPHQQGKHPFVAGLSVIDILMHLGVQGVREVLDSIAKDTGVIG